MIILLQSVEHMVVIWGKSWQSQCNESAHHGEIKKNTRNTAQKPADEISNRS